MEEEKSLPSECDMSGYNFNKAGDRYKWKCKQTEEIIHKLYNELKKYERHLQFQDNNIVVFSERLVSLDDFRSIAYQKYHINLE